MAKARSVYGGLKSKRTAGEPITPELYAELNTAYQYVAEKCAQLRVECTVSEYNGHKYIGSEIIQELYDAEFTV